METLAHYYDIEPLLDIDKFAELFIVGLGYFSTPVIYKEDKITSFLPSDYFDCIYKALTSEEMIDGRNVVISKFSKLIDIREYLEDRIGWQMKFADYLSAITNNLIDYEGVKGSFTIYDFTLSFEFPKEKAVEIISQFDEETLEAMELFLSVGFGIKNDYIESDYISENTKRKIIGGFITKKESINIHSDINDEFEQKVLEKIIPTPIYTKEDAERLHRRTY